MSELPIKKGVALAPLTTLELGGRAEYFLHAMQEEQVLAGLHWAADRDLCVSILGGGSNVLIPDVGVDGLVIHVANRGVSIHADGQVDAQAGEVWDTLVSVTVEKGLGGLECLSGIPGFVGATPIQNVGAYGQEVSETITSVRVVDRRTLQVQTLDREQCDFGYRNSRFKRDPTHIVLSVRYKLTPHAEPTLRYKELRQAVDTDPTLESVRDVVLRLRRSKSMVIDPSDPNTRSVGSFFTNPVVTRAKADQVANQALSLGLITSPDQMPRYPQEDGRVKLAAGWLVEKSGIDKGYRQGQVGVSSKHALALIHHGGGTTRELRELASSIIAQVNRVFDIRLDLEPQTLRPSDP